MIIHPLLFIPGFDLGTCFAFEAAAHGSRDISVHDQGVTTGIDETGPRVTCRVGPYYSARSGIRVKLFLTAPNPGRV